MTKKTVSLVLGSGAARGHAHIGVINAVLEQGYEIVSISGCSIGAIIGGIYLQGKLQEYQEWAESLDKFHVLRLLDMAVLRGGYISGDRYFHTIASLIDDIKIEELPLPYTAIGVDILSQKEFWFQKGSLMQAMRASSAVPSIVTPIQINGRVYVDGGVLNPLPIIPTVSAGADCIIAVDLNGPARELSEEEFIKQDNEPEWWSGVKNFFGKNKDDEEHSTKSYEPQNWGRLQTINMMFEAMQESLTQYKIAGYPPDLLISIPKDTCNFYEFWRSKELVEFGYNTAIKALEQLENPKQQHFSFPKGQ